MGYRVECTVCDFTAEVDTFGAIFELEDDHKSDAGDRHLLKWEDSPD